MIRSVFTRVTLAVLFALAAAGCSLIPGEPAPAPSDFTLAPRLAWTVESNAAARAERNAERNGETNAGTSVGKEAMPQPILIAPPGARPGFDDRRMIWVSRPYELRHFAHHRWVEPPARLLEPLLALALERSGVLRPLGSRSLDEPTLRLETEIIALQQEFDVRPSRVRFVLAARLVDPRSGGLVARTELEETEPAQTDDPYGGVVAANRALERALEALATWCEAHAHSPRARAGADGGDGGAAGEAP